MPNLYCHFRLYLRHVMSCCIGARRAPVALDVFASRVTVGFPRGWSWEGQVGGPVRRCAVDGFSPWDEEQPVRVNLLYRILVCV